MLARVHPKLERVKKPRRNTSRAVADGFTGETSEMRVHAANWISAHGHAYRDLAGSRKSKATKGEKANSALILVRQKAGKHPPHPAKHVLISRTTGRIRGEQG
jgi:hypothetical protein